MEIVKQSYSKSPWRLIDSEGRNVSYRKSFDHPDLGMTTIIDMVSGDTKQECIVNALSLLENILNSSSALLARVAELEAEIEKLKSQIPGLTP